jgi:hypothetical protein
MKYTQTDLETKEISYTTFGQIAVAAKRHFKLKPEQLFEDLKSGKKIKTNSYSYQWTVIELDDYYPKVISVDLDILKSDPIVYYFEDVYSAIDFKEEEEKFGYSCELIIPDLFKNANSQQFNEPISCDIKDNQ